MTEISVKTLSDIQNVIREHEIETDSKFRVVKTDKNFGNEGTDLSNVIKRIWFRDPQPDAMPIIPSTGIPFVVVGKKLLECHQGLDRDKNRKVKRKTEKDNKVDHDYRRKRKLVQPTKKKNCPVKIRIRHIIRFPEYKVLESS